MAEKLATIDFKKELGTIADKVERVAALARELAPKVGADPDMAERAARLAKADLVSGMVGEFPELQGVMGGYYAREQGLNNSVIPDAQRSGTQGGRDETAETGSRISAGALSGMTNLLEGLSEADVRKIADAIGGHYKPQGPSDAVPTEPVAIAVALADKLDTLVGFWAIDEKPTGSKDPFALRRAALGVVRIVLENGVRFNLKDVFWLTFRRYYSPFAMEFAFDACVTKRKGAPLWDLYLRALRNPYIRMLVAGGGISPWMLEDICRFNLGELKNDPLKSGNQTKSLDFFELLVELIGVFTEAKGLVVPKPASFNLDWNQSVLIEQNTENWIENGYLFYRDDYVDFFADRLKQYLRDQGARHDLIDAVFALGEDDLVLIVKRVEALAAFLETEDGANLLAGYKRAANILKAEEKKDGAAVEGDVDASLFEQDEERALHTAIKTAVSRADAALEAEDFEAAMAALAELRGPVDAFFDGVTVNADDEKLRANRLRLLTSIRAALFRVADFSKIAG